MDTHGMTPEEKAAVMQFMGQTYGQIHKSDQEIIGQAGNLKPKSNHMKQVFEQTSHIPTVHGQPQQQPPPQQQAPQQQAPPTPVEPVTPEQAAAELQKAPPVPTLIELYDDEPEVNPNQMEFNLSEPTVTDKLLDILKEQNLLLREISLKLDNGKKTTRGRKQG
jgi:hypothetical protein